MRPPIPVAAVVLAVLAGPAPVAGAPPWLAPVEGAPLRPFSVARDRYAAGQHRGVDLAAAAGTPVLAPCGGRVTFAGRVPSGGGTVSVRCGALIATLQRLTAIAVTEGRRVARGAPIAAAGRGRGPAHVHLGAREAATGRYLDPLALIGGAPGAPAPLPAPYGAPSPRDAPLGPAPAPRARRPLPAPRGSPRTAAPASGRWAPAPAPATPARPPWPVWAGVVLVALGLPLGGLVTVRRRSRRATALAARPRAAA